MNPTYAVVEFPGTDGEAVVYESDSARDAYRFLDELNDEGERYVDVMKRLADGTLTTEF